MFLNWTFYHADIWQIWVFKSQELVSQWSQVFPYHYTFNAFFELIHAVRNVFFNVDLDLLPGPVMLLDVGDIFFRTLSGYVDETTNHFTDFDEATRRSF